MIYFTSDLHFCHDREFLFKPRGFSNVDEMNEAIVKRWNDTVGENDTVYILGDLMLKDNAKGIEYINRLNGIKHIIYGNHDTASRIELYHNALKDVVQLSYAEMVDYNGYHFFCTHYPCLTGTLEKESLKQMTCNLFGHTHSKDKFYNDMPFMYNVALDAHNCTPVSIDEIISDMKVKVEECKSML